MILTILTILISVGYSALNQNLSVSGEAFLRAKDNIRISRIELSDAANDGYETYNPEYSKRTTKMYTTLPKDDSSVTYTVKVTNSTGIKYKVDSIEVTSTNPNVSCTPSIEKDSVIDVGIAEFTVTANYENGMSQDTNLNACDIKYEFVPLDVTPPTLTVQLVKDNGNTKTIKITATDEADGSGISDENNFKYYLSTSNTTLTGGEWKDYINSTEFEISGDLEVKYLWIYPVQDKAGNINDGKANVNTAYVIKTYTFVDNSPTLYNVIAKEALTGGVAKLYTGEHNDAYDESGTKKIFHFYGADDSKGTEVLTKNNVIFGGFCWQMIRTTDTGGTKLIYNGVPSEVDGKKVCTNSGASVAIGTSGFASASDSPAYAGYMYNTVYTNFTKNLEPNSESVFNVMHEIDTSYWYADSVSCGSGFTPDCTLVNPFQISSESDYSLLKGKYTFLDGEYETISGSILHLYYVTGVYDDTIFGIMGDENTIERYNNTIYTYGESYTKNEDGTYTINNPKTTKKIDYNYALLKDKYMCVDAVDNSCNQIWYVTSGGSYEYIPYISSDDEYKYAKGFTYENGKYILNDESVMIWDLKNSGEKAKINNAHYTCFNATGECETIYNINYIDSNNLIYYIELQNGKSLEDALNEMLYADDVNKTNSAIKNVIDTWYANNMTNYTKYLEDTVFCNDRTIADYGGWNSNGGNVSLGVITFINGQESNNEFLLNDNIYCANVTDRFSVGNSKAKLTYPVGMLSVNEMYLPGNNNARKSGANQWLMTPEKFNYTYISYSRHRVLGGEGLNDYPSQSTSTWYVRPSVSAAPGTKYATGTGSTTDPYIVDLNAPTLTQETLIDGEREKTVRITISDDYGLSSDNQYKYYLSTSETELVGGEWKDYILGEIFTLTGENETKYLWIYPVMDNAGNINDGKSDINTPYVLSTITFKDKTYLYDVLQKEAASGSGLAQLYTGQHNDTYNGTGTQNIYYFYGTDDTAATSALNKNNVLFAGFCWQIIRTTDTGGVKLIYNGVVKEVDGKNVCTNSGEAQQIETSAFNENDDSLAYAGYMYNTVYSYKSKKMSSSNIYKYAKNFTYSNGIYKLSSDAISINVTNIIEKANLNNAHYTCFNTTGECSIIYYVYYLNGKTVYYIELNDGKSVENALNEMLSADNTNKTNSTIKDVIDTWYANNMTNYTKYLEDTVFCNDRSISDYAGWNPNGGSVSNYLYFKNSSLNNDLYCTNVIDRFSVTNEKARLTYPAGLMSAPEMYLLGNNSIRKTGELYWLASPYHFSIVKAIEWDVGIRGDVDYNSVYNTYGVRPAVSLSPGTQYVAGTGSTTDPYVIKTS